MSNQENARIGHAMNPDESSLQSEIEGVASKPSKQTPNSDDEMHSNQSADDRNAGAAGAAGARGYYDWNKFLQDTQSPFKVRSSSGFFTVSDIANTSENESDSAHPTIEELRRKHAKILKSSFELISLLMNSFLQNFRDFISD